MENRSRIARSGLPPFVAVLLLALSACGDKTAAPDGGDAAEDEVAVDVSDVEPDGDEVDDTGDGEADVPPGPVDLSAAGVRVVIEPDPFSYTIYDEAGEARLSSLDAGSADGYGALGWTLGNLTWGTSISPGYASFRADLEPWRDDFIVVDADAAADRADLVLAPRGADGLPDPAGPRVLVSFVLRASTVRVEASVETGTPRAWAAAFASPADEGFLGFGERFTRTNHRGLDVYSWAEEGGIGGGEGSTPGPTNPFPNGESMAYYPVPFFVSTGSYGFWLDSTWRNEFNLATARDDAWRVWHIGPTFAFEVYVPLPGDARPWPYHLIDLFTAATGRPMIPPAWTLGPRRRINRTDMQGGVPEIEAMRDLDLPITGIDDAVHFLPRGSHVGREAELRAWIDSARALGYRVNAYYNPYFTTETDAAIRTTVEQGLAENWFLRDAAGDPSVVWMISGSRVDVYTLDFTVPEATAFYGDVLDWAVDVGYSGWMYDFGEYVQPGVVSGSGMTGEELHNLFPVLYQRAAYEHLEAGPLAGEWLTFVRSGYTGASQYAPLVWGGDPAASFEESDGLPSMIRAALNLGIAGAPHWGGDINGFHCVANGYAAADEELLVRWIQQGSMGSNMQDQDACSGAMDSGRKANIFDDPPAQEAWRTYARLHTRLFPYLDALAVEAHATGAPVMRHPFLEHPDRVDLAGADDWYYLGPSLLVAPVVERGAIRRDLALPAGRYLDWDDHTVLDGGTTVSLDAPLEKLPLLLLDGGLIPLLDPTIDTLAEETNAEVIGPGDVDAVYDVVGFVSAETGSAAFTLSDGAELSLTLTGAFAAPAYPEAVDEAELSTCTSCWLADDLGGGLRRVRISTSDPTVAAGGLALSSGVARRIRWDLFLVE